MDALSNYSYSSQLTKFSSRKLYTLETRRDNVRTEHIPRLPGDRELGYKQRSSSAPARPRETPYQLATRDQQLQKPKHLVLALKHANSFQSKFTSQGLSFAVEMKL